MSAQPNASLLAVLVATGATWGLTQPLAKIVVSEGYRDFGIIFWQFVIGALLLGAYQIVRRRPLPLRPDALRFYLLIALIGTILPNWGSFTAAVHLPAGVLSIVIALVPMLTFPIALALGMDRFSALRLLGLVLGLAAIVLIAAPEASLPDPAMALWLPVAIIAPTFYAIEANVVAKWGTAGLGPVQVLLGASILGAILTAPIAVATDTFIDPFHPWGVADWGLVGMAVAHATAYAVYVWLVGQAGAVFTAQVGYVVTGFGVLWAKLILGESYSGWVWAALVVMMVGLFLVSPRRGEVAPAPTPL